MNEGKIPPHNLEIESNFLGGLLIDNNLIDRVGYVKPEYFYRPNNSVIYQVITELYGEGNPVDLITVTERLANKDLLTGDLSPYYLTELTTSFTSSETVHYSAQKIIEYWKTRDFINITSSLRDRAFDSTSDISELINTAQESMFELSKGHKTQIKEFDVNTTMERIKNVETRGVRTYYSSIDDKIFGFMKGDLIIIAGRPSHGKSAFKKSLITNQCLHGHKIGSINLEMTELQENCRIIAEVANIDSKSLLYKGGTDYDFQRVTENLHKLNKIKLYQTDDAFDIDEIFSVATDMVRDGCEAIYGDYLQLVPNFTKHNANTWLGMITRRSKQFSHKYDVPFIWLSQLNRKIEDRTTKDPALADLRESGSIEQDADMVIFVNRKELYLNPDKSSYQEDLLKLENKADIIIAKGRNTGIGRLEFVYRKEQTRFDELSKEEIF